MSTKVKAVKKTELEKENEKLKKQNEDLEARFSRLEAMMSVGTTTVVQPNKARYIKVTSLVDMPLILTTGPNGSGKIYTFDSIGKTFSIIDYELRDIVGYQRRFATNGYFYIADREFVDEIGLADEYENILDLKTINKILDSDKADEMVTILSNTTEGQRINIFDIMRKKVMNGSINMDVVYKVEKKFNVDIARSAEESKSDLEFLKNL